MNFLPNALPNLVGWWKADAIAGVSDGSPISIWPDSGNLSNHVSQDTAARRPIYRTNVFNGRPVVRFDGVDDDMASPSGTLYTAPLTICAVVRYSGVDDALPHWPIGLGTVHCAIEYNLTSPGDRINFIGTGGAVLGPMFDANWHQMVATIPTDLNATFHIDNVLYGPSAVTLSVNQNPPFRLGSRAGTGRFWLGDCSEFIVYSRALVASERDQLREYWDRNDPTTVPLSSYIVEKPAPMPAANTRGLRKAVYAD